MSLEVQLPPLREDLSLLRGPLVEGTPTWTVYDPAQRRYLRLDWLDFEILRRWGLRTPTAIVGSLNGETTLHAVENDVVHVRLLLSLVIARSEATKQSTFPLAETWIASLRSQ